MDTIRTYTKKIKDSPVISKEIDDLRDIEKIISIIGKLEETQSAMTSSFQEIALRTNPKKWIQKILDCPIGYDPIHEMESLLNDFTEGMQTRMREESKYALGMLMENRLILVHSTYGEETITPQWSIIPRMLDTDNVLRFVSFMGYEGSIQVRYWERTATSSFVDWLGLPKKQAFLFGGKYRICTDIDNFTAEIQLNDEEVDQWLTDHPEMKESKITLKNPVYSLSIRGINSGQKKYNNPEDFIQDFKAEKFGVPLYQKEYNRIKASYLPLLTKCIDEELRVISIEGDTEVNVVVKKSLPFHVLFADGDIELRSSYLAVLSRKLCNGEAFSIFHAGQKFLSDPIVIGNLQIYNELNTNEMMLRIIKYLNEVNLQDHLLTLLIKYAALKIAAITNSKLPLGYVCGALSEGIVTVREINIVGKLSKVEDDIIEYKSRDTIKSKDTEIINYYVDDIKKKLVNSTCKLYIIGVEDGGTFAPIQSAKIASDRIDNIRKGIQKEFPFMRILMFSASNQENTLVFIAIFK
jgi:hypothetical protein